MKFKWSSIAGSAAITVYYTDMTSSAITPGVQTTAVGGTTTATTVLSAPAASTQRVVKEIRISLYGGATNADYSLSIVNTTASTDLSILGGGDSATTNTRSYESSIIQYTETGGWQLMSMNAENQQPIKLNCTGKYWQPLKGMCDRANATATIALATQAPVAVYLGPVNYAAQGAVIQFRVTTAPATSITYVECALAQGSISAGANVTLYRLGFLAWDQMSGTGVKSFFIPFSYPPDATKGDDLFAIIGTQASTAGTLRGGLADDLQSGGYATGSSLRPSSITNPSGAGSSFTIAGATTVVPLVMGYYI